MRKFPFGMSLLFRVQLTALMPTYYKGQTLCALFPSYFIGVPAEQRGLVNSSSFRSQNLFRLHVIVFTPRRLPNACDRSRTYNLIFRKDLLYPLSYTSIAVREGVEPPPLGSEPSVLPLDYPTKQYLWRDLNSHFAD